MFALSALVDAAVPPSPLPLAGDAIDLRDLPAEYRFPVPGVPAIKLPKRPEQVTVALVDAGNAAPLLWTALTRPVHRIPLGAHDGERRAALVTGCLEGDALVVVEARLAVRPGSSRHRPPELTSVAFATAHGNDEAVDLLERLWADADPSAHAAAAGPRALWLGGDPARAVAGGGHRVGGVCAAFGLRAEIVVDAPRHVQQVVARIGNGPPGYLILWRSQAHGVEPAVAAFRAASEGEIIELAEPALDDALLELRWALADLGLDGHLPSEAAPLDKPAPAAGEERYYIKHHGSATGDRMIEVADCGHGQWGSDARRKAPRAYKGITAGVGVTLQALFRCAKCSKNRWRARF